MEGIKGFEDLKGGAEEPCACAGGVQSYTAISQ